RRLLGRPPRSPGEMFGPARPPRPRDPRVTLLRRAAAAAPDRGATVLDRRSGPRGPVAGQEVPARVHETTHGDHGELTRGPRPPRRPVRRLPRPPPQRRRPRRARRRTRLLGRLAPPVLGIRPPARP